MWSTKGSYLVLYNFRTLLDLRTKDLTLVLIQILNDSLSFLQMGLLFMLIHR